MDVSNISKNCNVIIFGIGNEYLRWKKEIEKYFIISAVSDNYLEYECEYEYEYVKPEEIQNRFEEPVVIVVTSLENYWKISEQLTYIGIEHHHFRNFSQLNLDWKFILLNKYIGVKYCDYDGNTVDIDSSVKIDGKSILKFGRASRYGEISPNPKCCNFQIGPESIISNLSVEFLGDKNKIILGIKNNIIQGCSLILAQGSKFITGVGTSIEDLTVYEYEQGVVTIGDDCMLSHNIQIWQTDTHPIFDIATELRINVSESVSIGDHVWVGTGVRLMGGAKIGAGCVVGLNSITSNEFPENSVIAGIPARVIRENIKWERDDLALV